MNKIIKQISEEIESIQSNEEELANKLSENPEVAKEYITNEIKKADFSPCTYFRIFKIIKYNFSSMFF